ncbi:hypothetical protein SAMN00790413_00885 [Deinococcus hopiensis KR-140]|uniref:Uncharacterized protein n=1 Tax=Deinococcus hopiensis KR-140 TaxID=695939 RepID=A0A1W1VC36_9DEIO|nr:hypothetical protein SAMN00790413_00885 [Deinococcus hopiensis KR-140]
MHRGGPSAVVPVRSGMQDTAGQRTAGARAVGPKGSPLGSAAVWGAFSGMGAMAARPTPWQSATAARSKPCGQAPLLSFGAFGAVGQRRDQRKRLRGVSFSRSLIINAYEDVTLPCDGLGRRQTAVWNRPRDRSRPGTRWHMGPQEETPAVREKGWKVGPSPERPPSTLTVPLLPALTFRPSFSNHPKRNCAPTRWPIP